MPSQQPTELARFLAATAPFGSLSHAELEAVAAGSTIDRIAAGDLIVDAFTEPPTEIYVVLDGVVDIWHDPNRVAGPPDDRFAAGSLIGFSALLTDRPVGPRVAACTAARVARIPGALAEPAFFTPGGATFLAEYISHVHRLTADPPVFSTVEDLIPTEPVVVGPGVPVAEVARRLREREFPCAVVDLGNGTFGIVTDAVLSRRVVAEELALDTPARAVMEHPAPTVALSESAAEALLVLLDSGADHLLVVDRSGALRGVVDARDFVLSPTTAGVGIIEQVRRARTADDLVARASRARDVLADVLARGLASDRAITVYSAIVDAIVRQSIQLVLAEHDDLSSDAFTWLSLGSNGRREAVPCSDVDAAVSFDNRLTAPEMARYRTAFAQVEALLVRAGLSIDAHGAFPTRAPFSRTNAEWRAAAKRWLAEPSVNQGSIMASLLVDGRPIHGDPGLPEVARVFTDFRRHPATMRLVLEESLSRRAKRRSVRKLLTGKGDEFDVKSHGLLPVVNVARWAALGVGSTELQTAKRLRDAGGSEILPTHQADRLIEVFELLQRMRLRHQLNQVARGEPPTDVIDRDELSPIERSMLAQAVHEVNAIQRRMDNVARFTPPESWAVRRARSAGRGEVP